MSEQQTPRNAPCPCGSGRKFKTCCMGKSRVTPAPAPLGPGLYQTYVAHDSQGRGVVYKLKPLDINAPDLTYEEANAVFTVESDFTDAEPITFAVGSSAVTVLPPAIKQVHLVDDDLDGRCLILDLHIGETIRLVGEMAAKVCRFMQDRGYLPRTGPPHP